MFRYLAKCGYFNPKTKNMTSGKNKAVFLDRDGTIHVDKVETRKIEDLEFFDDTIDFMRKMNELGYLIVIVTNQSGIGKGHYDVAEMRMFNNHMICELEKSGVVVSALYYCPHTAEDNCFCMKPKDGMLRRAELELNIDSSKSIMIGDQTHDVQAGIAKGIGANYIVTTGIYDTPNGKYELPKELKGKVTVCHSLTEVISHYIISK